MATQWIAADMPQLILAAHCYEKALKSPSGEAAKEFKQWSDGFGLSPQGRLRNRWIVEEDDQQDESGAGVVRLHPERGPDGGAA